MVVFLDTNVFLHYRRFTEIDWLAVTGERQVTIAFPPITLRELNEKKDGGASQKIKRRAQAALIDIERLFRSELRATIREGVFGECITSEPQIDFAAHQLRTDIQDDWLIASVLEQKRRDGTQHSVLVTADLGLKLKCRAHKIEVLQLSDDLKLPEEEDSEAKRIRQLEAENQVLRSTAPVLNLSFAGGESVLKQKLRPEVAFKEEEAERRLRNAKQKLRKMAHGKTDAPRGVTVREALAAGTALFGGYDEEDIKAYNADLDSYFAAFVDGERQQHVYENLLLRTYELEIAVTNNGTTPAADIVIHMHFPDGFSLFTTKDFPGRPNRPKPPERPLTFSQRIQQSIHPIGVPSISAYRPDFSAINAPRERFSVRRTNSYDVDIEYEKLNHGFTKRLKKLLLVIDQPAKPISFHIDYEIHAANLPKPSVGRLHVVIEE